MKIAFNPSTVAALTTPPNNKDITFDLRGRNIFARGVKFCGTDTWRDIKINNVSIGSNILDLRNGSNTTLTNTNGVVTINSTWRPVVDNLTSDSTTSSLSANQGRVLKSLIDGKSNSGHTHDDRYLKLTGGTMTGNIILSPNTKIIKPLASTSNYDSIVRWSVDGETKKYGREIGLHNTGGDSTGSIAIIPYKTDTEPWSGNVGLFIAKNTLKLDGKPIALKNDIPTSLKNPYSLTLQANGTTLATYDGSVSKIVNLTYDNVGAAAKNHTHNSLEPWASYITGDSHATALKSIFDKNKTSIPRNKFISMFSSTYGNGSYYMGYFLNGYENAPYGGFFVAHYDTAYYIGISNGSFAQHRLVYSTDIPNSLKNPHALTISLNGTSQGPYDGSAAKSINITPSSIGAATSEHNHDNRYLKLTGGTMQLGEGLKFHADDNYFGTNSDARIISLLDSNGAICDGGLIIDERGTLDGKEYITELLRIRDSEFKWKGSNILHNGNSHINGNTITINGSSLTVSKSDHTHSNYVTALGTNGNYLTWTKNGSTNNITVPYATTSSYLTNGFSAPFVNKWDCNAPDRVVYSDYGSDGRLITNHPSGWHYGTLLELGHTNHRGINGVLNIQLMWDIAHNTTLPGTLWFRGKDEVNGWAKSWAKVITDQNISSILSNYYTKSETDGKYVTLTTPQTIGGSKTFTTGIQFNTNKNGDANLGSNDGFKLFYNETSGKNFPGNYYNVASFITGYTGFQLACYGGTDQALKYRHRQDNGTWHPWKTLAFTTDIPSSLKNPYSLTTFGVVYDGSAAKVVGTSNFISQLEEGTSVVTDGTMFITSWASNSGFADTNAVNIPYKRKAIHLWNYIKTKTDSLYYTESEVNNLLSNKLNTSDFNWTNLPGKLVGENEFNIANAGFNSDIWFNYVPINDRSKTASIHTYIMGNGAKGMASVTASGFIKNGSSSSYVLLGDGGHKTISSLSVNYANSAGNADTVDGYHATSGRTFNGNINWASNWNDTWSDGTHTHPWYGFDHRYPNTGAYSTTISDYFGMTIKTANTLRLDFGTLLLNGTSIYSINVASATKLQTPRSIWGHSFNGTADVNGTIYINNNNSSEGAIRLNNNINSNARISAIDSQVIFNTDAAIRFGGTSWDWNVWAGLKYTHSNKTIYLGIADNSIFNANSAQSGGSLRFPGISNVYATTFNGSLSGNASTATNADKVDGYHANGLLTALSNSNNGISITVGGTTKSISNISVNYANSAGSATKVIVNQHTTNDTNYPLVWSNQSNTNSVTENQLYKSWSDLYYNPKNKRLTVGGSVVASSFIKSGGTSQQLLRADGGIATFNWSGQSGQPTWLWGGNNQHSYYVYNPSNFRVAYATSAGSADTLDGVHLSGIFTAFGNNGHNITATIGGTTKSFLVNWAADSDKLDGYHASNLLTSVTNTNNGISVTVGGTTKSVSNISVNYASSAGSADTAQYLRSLGNQNCQTGRTQNYGDVYTYNTYANNTGAPTSYTSVIGFGRGIAGTVEIAGGWDNTNLYWRSLRDCCEDWHSWRTVLDSSNYTEFINNYYWANVKISTSSSTTTSPTVSNLTATSSIRMGNIYLQNTNEINSASGIHLNYQNSGNISLCAGGGNVGIGTISPAYKLDVNGQVRASGFRHSSVNSDNYVLLAGGGYKSFGGDSSHPVFLGYLNLDHGSNGTVSSSFYCLGYSVPFTYTRGGNYCKISIPDTTHQAFYIKAATASVNYSGGGMDTWTGNNRGAGAWWLHCYAPSSNEVRVKGFHQKDTNNDSWWGGNPLWSDRSGANRITVCIFGYVTFR